MHHPGGGTNPRRMTRSSAHHSSPFMPPEGGMQGFSFGFSFGLSFQSSAPGMRRRGRAGQKNGNRARRFSGRRLPRYLLAFFSQSIRLSGNNEFRFGAKCSKQAPWDLPS
jgi:hypothetical protein